MAKESQETLNQFTPEQNFAQLISKRHDFKPGDPLGPLVENFADLTILDFPDHSVDGVSLNLKKPGVRPEILINKRIPLVRQRFTLAHELGHVVIPWHFGTIFSNIDHYQASADFAYREKEAEANRFAAELLMPKSWISSIIEQRSGDASAACQAVRDFAKTSNAAAVIAVNNSLSQGYVYVCLTEHDRVISSYKSAGTNVPELNENADFRKSEIRLKAEGEQCYEYNNHRHCWLKFGSRKDLPSLGHLPWLEDERTWKEMLEEILSDINVHDPKDRLHLKQRLNGIIASANTSSIDKETLYAKLSQRVLGRDIDIQKIVDHPLFESVLVKRVHEFLDRRR